MKNNKKEKILTRECPYCGHSIEHDGTKDCVVCSFCKYPVGLIGAILSKK